MSECHFCGDSDEIEEHHIIPNRFGGPDTTENLVPLCSLCHKKIEQMYDGSFYSWFGVSDERGNRWAFKPCSFPSCDSEPDRLVVLSGSVIDDAGDAKAVARELQQPVCDECLVESVELIDDAGKLPRSVSEEIDRRTVREVQR